MVYRVIRIEDPEANYRRGDEILWFHKASRKWVEAIIVNAVYPEVEVEEPLANTTLWWVRDNYVTRAWDRLRVTETQILRRSHGG
jgi:hypothetical protein